MRLTWAPGSCSTCCPSGSHPSPSLGPLDFESSVRGYAGCADSAPAKGRPGVPSSARRAESRLRAGRRRPFGTRSCGLGASLLGDPAAPPPRTSQLTPSRAPRPSSASETVTLETRTPRGRPGPDPASERRAQKYLLSSVLTHLIDLPFSYLLCSACLSIQLI